MTILVFYALAVVAVLGGLVVLAALGLAWLRAGARRTAVPPTMRQARRHQIGVVLLAGLVAVGTLTGLTAVWLNEPPIWRIGIVPALACTAALAVLALGELTWPQPRGRTRTARLDARTWSTVLDGVWPRAYAAGLAVMTIVLGVATAVAQPDGMSIGWRTATRAASAGPFPGGYYALPQALALLVLTAVALGCARAAMQRPALGALSVERDHQLRRASAGRAFRIALVGVGLTLAADLFLAGAATASAWDAGPAHLLGRSLQLLAPVIMLGLLAVTVSSSGARRLLLTPSVAMDSPAAAGDPVATRG